MNIGIDARTILNPEKGDDIGVGHYTYQLIRHLLDIDSENTYTLFFDYRVREKDVKKFTRDNTRVKFYPFSDYKKYLPGAYNEILGRATLARENLDVLHSTSPMSRIPAGYTGKTVTTIHNLSVCSHPEAFPRMRRSKGQAVIKFMAGKSDTFIAPSQSIKDELKSLAQVEDEKIHVIHSGLDHRFFDESQMSQEKILGKFGITKKYILFLGTLAPINNITRLIEAFALFKKRYQKEFNKKSCPYQLVLAGKRGWLSQEYRQVIKDFGVTKDVVFTGYVIGDELVPLFKGAEFFVLPSLYEGFGTTMLEAFATGTPAIVSEVSSLPEIAGDAAKFVNPVNVEEISNALWKFSQNESLREEYRKKGLKKAKEYSWDKAAKETLEVYKELRKK